MGEVITFPDQNTRPQRPLDNTIRSPHGADIVFLGDSKEYYNLEELVREQIHSLAEGVTDLSSAEIAQALHQINSGIGDLNRYRSGVPKGIVYNMHTLLEKIGVSERGITLPPYITACLVETTKAFDKTDERALGAAALLPMNGSRLYDLDHYRKIDDKPPPAA